MYIGGTVGVLDRLAELIQGAKANDEGYAVTDCNVLWSVETHEEQKALLAAVKKVEIEGVEIVVEGDTLRIRAKTR